MPALAPAATRARSAPSRFSSLLCAVDLSDVGEACVAVAYALARGGGVVHLLHVVRPQEASDAAALLAGLGPSSEAPRPFEEVAREARARLADLVPGDASAQSVRTEVRVVEADDPADAVSRLAADLKVDAIVAGTHGRTGFGHVLMGSVASQLVRTSPTPVLLVYPGRKALRGRGLTPPFRSLLCPTDLSTRSNEAVPVAYALSGEEGTVHLLHVGHRPFGSSGNPDEESRTWQESARRGLDALAAGTPGRGARTKIHVVEDDDPAVTIARHAATLPADVVVLGTHGRTGIERVRMGTVASEAIRGGAAVVLVPRLCDEAP
jgi:nucleotide-binding universal stress UspA family protein